MHVAARWPRAIALSLAIGAALSGIACSQRAENAAAASAGKMQESVAADAAAPAPEAQQALASRNATGAAGGADQVAGLANRNGSQLAYALDVRVRLPAPRIADNLTKVREACASQQYGPCDVLGEQLDAGEFPTGTLQLRAAPAAVGSLVKAAAEGGALAQRSSTAEDLAFAVRDNGMRRKRLELQHAKLMEIAQRRDIKVDELMALTERLAMLEAELHAAEQEAAVQQSRIATNQLTLHFDPENVAVASETSTRISEALRGLTGTWDQIIAWMISAFLGVIFPVVLVFGTATWLVIRLLRRHAPATPKA